MFVIRIRIIFWKQIHCLIYWIFDDPFEGRRVLASWGEVIDDSLSKAWRNVPTNVDIGLLAGRKRNRIWLIEFWASIKLQKWAQCGFPNNIGSAELVFEAAQLRIMRHIRHCFIFYGCWEECLQRFLRRSIVARLNCGCWKWLESIIGQSLLA